MGQAVEVIFEIIVNLSIAKLLQFFEIPVKLGFLIANLFIQKLNKNVHKIYQTAHAYYTFCVAPM